MDTDVGTVSIKNELNGNEEQKNNNTIHPAALKSINSCDRPMYEISESKRMMRNVILISVSFTLLFTADSSMANLQSSIHEVDGLGNWSSAVVYGSLIISALFVPTAFIRKVTVKWAIYISMFGYTTTIIAQFYPAFWTLLPAAAIVGVSASCLWSAKCTYLTHVGHEYATLLSLNPDDVIVKFFSIFFTSYQTNGVFGNILSSTILSSSLGTTDSNDTTPILPYERCGRNFCPGTELSSSSNKEENKTKIYILAGVLLLISLSAGSVIGLFVDSLQRYNEKKSEDNTKKMLKATFRQMRKPIQILIIPLTIWCGMEQGFLIADYTAAFISCGWGVHNVGYVLICYGIMDSISCLCYARVIRVVGRVLIFFIGAVMNVGLIIGLLHWRPHPDDKIYFFVFAGLWGVADSCWQCGISAYYGVIFSEDVEATFSNYRLWEGVGFLTAFVVANLVCVETTLYLLMGMLGLGMAGFSIIEYSLWQKRRRDQSGEVINIKD